MADDTDHTLLRQDAIELRDLCVQLQSLEARSVGAGVAELRRMAATDGDSHAFGLCRLLFRSRDDQPLRQKGALSFLLMGGAKVDACPHAPFYVSRGIPFYIATGFRHSGPLMAVDGYLSFCLEAGDWVSEPYRESGRDEVLAAAHELLEHGPWSRPLHSYERDWLLAQVPME